MDYHSTLNFFFTKSLLLTITNINHVIILLIILFSLLLISFITTGAERAFFSLTNKNINFLKTKQDKVYTRIIALIEEPKKLHTSLTITSYFTNISSIIIANRIIDDLMPENLLFWFILIIKIAIISFLLLLFTKVLPNIIATQNNIRFAKDFGLIVEGLNFLLHPISTWLITYNNKKKNISTQKLEELDEAINLNNTSVTEEEKNILKGIVKFSNITVKQIMRSRLDVNGIEYNSNFIAVKKQVEDLHYSRLPVYKTNLDTIVGIIHTKDLLPYLNEENYDWHQQVQQPFFVHEQKLIEDLLREFQARHRHFAIVVDEFGGTSGIVTLEDIIEEIIGDIHDEFDDEEGLTKKLDEYNYIFSGKTTINDLCKRMGLPINTFDAVKGDSESLAGLMLELNEDIPTLNQIITFGDFTFTILSIEKNRVDNIKVTIHKPQEQ